VDGLGFAVDDRFAQLRALLVGRGEVAQVLGCKLRFEPGDEDGRAEDLGEAGGVVGQRVARRRNVGGVELERLRAGEQGVEIGILRRSGEGGEEKEGRREGS